MPNGDKLVSGAMSLDDVRDRLEVVIVDEEHETIGGHVFGTLGRVPRVGDVVDTDTWRFVVEELDGRRIHTLRAIRRPDPEPIPGNDATS
jgi:CBS domain containing-hemolysin-like protein